MVGFYKLEWRSNLDGGDYRQQHILYNMYQRHENLDAAIRATMHKVMRQFRHDPDQYIGTVIHLYQVLQSGHYSQGTVVAVFTPDGSDNYVMPRATQVKIMSNYPEPNRPPDTGRCVEIF